MMHDSSANDYEEWLASADADDLPITYNRRRSVVPITGTFNTEEDDAIFPSVGFFRGERLG